MAKRASPTAIGGFIVAALTLIVAAVIVLGAGNFLRPRHEFVCFFSGNLNGLKIGAPVKFRGVQIGSVTAIKLRLPGQKRIIETDPRNAALPVIIQIDESQIAGLGGAGNFGSDALLKAFIANGLRAQLATESLLTGLLYIDLNFHEDTQPKFVLPPGSKYREIPTVPTALEELQGKALRALAKLDQIDFGALISALTDTAKATRELVGSPELKATIAQLKDTAASMKVAMASIAKTTDRLDSHIDPVIDSLKKTSDQAALTLSSTQVTLNDLNGVFDPDSPFGYRLINALQNVSDASQAVTALADYLHQNPAALVRGRADAAAAP